jgi:hypothetical protein
VPSQNKIIRIPRPFTKGWVTDRPRWALDPQEMADGQDVFWPRGVAVQRRPWDYVQATNPLGSSGTLGGVLAVQLSPDSSDVTFVVTDGSGRVGVSNTGSAQTAFTGLANTTYIPRAFYDGEVLLCPQDGISPILRWGGLNGSLTQITNIELVEPGDPYTFSGTTTTASSGGFFSSGSAPLSGVSVSFARESKVLSGVGTEFTTTSPARAYMGLNRDGNFGLHLRVDKVESDTRLSLKTAPFMLSTATSPVTIETGFVQMSPFGVLGLRAAVTQMGTATVSGTTLTGLATDWLGSGAGYARLQQGDVIAQLPQLAIGSSTAVTSSPQVGIVETVTSANTATLLYTPATTFTDAPYVALRSMPGRDVCQHQGRLWITGVRWEPNRVFVTPVSGSVIDQRAGRTYDLGQPLNGEDNYETDFANGSQAKFVDIPDRFADGRVVSLLSSRNVLLVLRSNSCHGIFGAWPGITVEQIADGAGCVDVRATASGEDGQFWAGEEGIYQYVPGRGIIDISENKVGREWRRIMRGRSSGAIVSLGIVNRHLVVSYLDGAAYGIGSGQQESFTWLYDISSGTWCGKVSDVRARYMNTSRLRGLPDELFFVEGNPTTRKIGALASAFTDDDSVAVTGSNIPTFYAETGSIITGQATDSFRVTEMRVGYECEGTVNPTLVVKTSASDSSPTVTQATLPATTDITTAKLRSSTSSATNAGIGKQTRQFSTRIEQGSEKPQVARIHEMQIVAREYSPRD